MAHAVDLEAVRAVAEEERRTSTFSPVAWWLFPQVLSLDAAAVAVSWQWLFARAFGVPVTPRVLFITAACVWMIYVADHLLDVRAGLVYSARHRLVAQHGRAFVVAGFAVFAVAAMTSSRLPLSMWRGALELTGAVGMYLALVHYGGKKVRRWWPKEFAIGAVFAAGSSIATWSAHGAAVGFLLAVALFACACTLNCCAVDYWEWRTNRVLLRYPHRATRWVAQHFLWCAGAVALSSGALAIWAPSTIAFAILVSSLLLMAVAAVGESLAPELARLLADTALLTPLLFLFR